MGKEGEGRDVVVVVGRKKEKDKGSRLDRVEEIRWGVVVYVERSNNECIPCSGAQLLTTNEMETRRNDGRLADTGGYLR